MEIDEPLRNSGNPFTFNYQQDMMSRRSRAEFGELQVGEPLPILALGEIGNASPPNACCGCPMSQEASKWWDETGDSKS